MLQGRWCGDAFLLYIRRQLQQFSEGLSKGMVRKESFFTIPENELHKRDDPRTRNQNSAASCLPLNGPGPRGLRHVAAKPAFSLWG